VTRTVRGFSKNRRGISTIFGAVFMVTIMLLALNLMIWTMMQHDAYQQVVANMNQMDQERISENIEFLYPGVVNFQSGPSYYTFDISVNNEGGVSVQVACVYIRGGSPGNSLKIIERQAPGLTMNYFSNYTVKLGEKDHRIRVKTDRNINDGNTYTLIIATDRGRIFSQIYPFPSLLGGGSQSWVDIGPLRILIQYESVKYTSSDHPTPYMDPVGWVAPSNTPLIWYIKMQNIGQGDVKLLKYTIFFDMEYKQGGLGASVPFYIIDPQSNYPGGSPGVVAYNEVTNPYVLYSSPTPPGPEVTVKFSSSAMAGSSPNKFPTGATQYFVFMGVFYSYQGHEYGVTIPFIAMRTTA